MFFNFSKALSETNHATNKESLLADVIIKIVFALCIFDKKRLDLQPNELIL